MSIDTLYVMRATAPRAGFKDLDVVTLTTAVVTDDGDLMPAGTRGTIVGIWRDGEAYLVEFPEPLGALATVGPEGIRSAEPTAQ